MEGNVSQWVRCTKPNPTDPVIYINLDVALTMKRMGNGMTRISFVGEKDSHVDVSETPDAILALPRK